MSHGICLKKSFSGYQPNFFFEGNQKHRYFFFLALLITEMKYKNVTANMMMIKTQIKFERFKVVEIQKKCSKTTVNRNEFC